MAFSTQPSSSHHPAYETFQNYANPSSSYGQSAPPQFDILDWHPKYLSCQRYFLDHAQHSAGVQAMAAFINIQLPCQKASPIMDSRLTTCVDPELYRGGQGRNGQPLLAVPLIPYIRRLVITGQDAHGVLHGFFGDDWLKGVGDLHEIERRNYLFAAKSQSWLKVKESYDMGRGEEVPFMVPLKEVTEKEIQAAESAWSDWLAMGDWMLGPRAPDNMDRDTEALGRGHMFGRGRGDAHVKSEPRE